MNFTQLAKTKMLTTLKQNLGNSNLTKERFNDKKKGGDDLLLTLQTMQDALPLLKLKTSFTNSSFSRVSLATCASSSAIRFVYSDSRFKSFSYCTCEKDGAIGPSGGLQNTFNTKVKNTTMTIRNYHQTLFQSQSFAAVTHCQCEPESRCPQRAFGRFRPRQGQ